MLTVNLLGNLGADAAIKEKNGNRFLSMNVAHTERVKDASGNYISQTQWVSVTLNHYSEKLLPYLTRGRKVYVAGKLYSRIWFDKDNRPNIGLNCLADTLELCGGDNSQTNNQGATQPPTTTPPTAPVAQKQQTPATNQSDLPF